MRKLRDKATEAFAKGRFSKAAEFYEEYCKGEPKDYQARLRMGDAWAKAGQKDRAISAYQLAATGFAREGFLPRAIAASKLILELDPAHKGIQQMLADLYARKSAGGNGAPQQPARPPRQVELPTFTEHMGTSMGPAVAPLELPEEDEAPPAPAPAMASPQRAIIPPPPSAPSAVTGSAVEALPEEEEEIAVVQGVPLTPLPLAPSAVAAIAAQSQPPAPAAGGGAPLPPQPALRAQPPAPAAAVPAPQVQPTPPAAAPAPQAVDAPRAAELVGPSVPAAPPGLALRSSMQRPPVAASTQASPSRPAETAPVPVSAVSSPDETALEVDVGMGTKKLSWSAISEPLISATSSGTASASETLAQAQPPLPSTAPAPASAAPPGLRPRRSGEGGTADMSVTPAPGRSAVVPPGQVPASPNAFTELELEEDTLLHAVEEAALAGMKQRAASGLVPPQEEEEEIILTDEVEETPSPNALPTIPLFSDLPREAFIDLFERCPLRHFSQGAHVFEQGSHGDAFYVICEGSVRVFRYENGQRKDLAALTSGAFFGEMALLSGAPRMAAVESAVDGTMLLEISAPVLAELSRQHPQLAKALKKFCRERMLTNVMSHSALFEPFSRKDRRTLVEKFRAREVKKNEIIVREGERTDGLYVVLSGEVEARKGDQVLSRMKEGDLFGEISLLSKTPATATVMSTRHTSLLRLPREDFDALILSHPQILVLISELSEQRLRRTEALTGTLVFELRAEDLLV
nr:cyclic nucleotide-binding domain-containing protein [Hyalangium minutum]